MHTHTHIYMHVCVCVYIYTRVFVHVYVFIHARVGDSMVDAFLKIILSYKEKTPAASFKTFSYYTMTSFTMFLLVYFSNIDCNDCIPSVLQILSPIVYFFLRDFCIQ